MADIGFYIRGSTYNLEPGVSIPQDISDRAIAYICRKYPKRNEDGTLAPPDVKFAVEERFRVFWEGEVRDMIEDEKRIAMEAAAATVKPVTYVPLVDDAK